MQYLMLINLGPRARDFKSLSAHEQQAIAEGYQTLNQTPGVTVGLGLQPPETATTVRVDGGETQLADGPLVDTNQALDGYFVLEADNLDAAIEVASRVPAVSMGGAVEIRPVTNWSQA
jgi:hypothetical protein